MEKIKIAIIDDKQSILDRFQSNYDNDEYEIHTFLSLEEALPIIEKDYYSFHFVILDGKGHTEKGETGDGDERFALMAREEIEKLITKKGRDLPFCYYTAYSEERIMQILPSFTYNGTKDSVKVFNKKSETDETKMFGYIRERYEKLEETSIKRRYSNVFEAFQPGLLDTTVERDLINTIKLLNNLNDDNAKQFARNIRPLMESIYSRLSTIDRKFVSVNVRQGDEQSLSNAIWFIAGKPQRNRVTNNYEFGSEKHMPIHLYEMVTSLQRATSQSAMHNYTIPISRYSAKSYAYILFDLLIWFKELGKQYV